MAEVKFSEFTAGGSMKVGDIVVGLRGGTNYQFTFPNDEIQDANGNILYKYVTSGAGAVNYLQMSNSDTGNDPSITAAGSDANISVSIQGKGTGSVVLESLTWPLGDGTAGQSLVTDGEGQLSFATESGTGDILTQNFMHMGA
jgi:hypothetical protein